MFLNHINKLSTLQKSIKSINKMTMIQNVRSNLIKIIYQMNFPQNR